MTAPIQTGVTKTALRLFATGVLVTIVATAIAGGSRFARSPVDQLRNGPGVENHPVHVRPSSAVAIPKGWPLDHAGSITCLTCHTQLPGLRDGADPVLRGVEAGTRPGVEFCANCHRSTETRTAAGMHWMAVRVAHVKLEQDRSASSFGLMDEDSRRCLECHDGVSTGESANSLGRGHGGSDMRKNHPVGVEYRSNKPPGSRTQLRSEFMLPAEIRLPGGKVSCVSCHNLYSSERYRLSVPIERSELCFACHAMD